MSKTRIAAVVLACATVLAVVTPQSPASGQERKATGRVVKMEDPTQVCADRSKRSCKRASKTCEYLVNPNEGRRARSGEKMKGQCYARVEAIAEYKTYLQNGGEADPRVPKCDSCGDPNGGISYWPTPSSNPVNASFTVSRDLDAAGNCPSGWIKFFNGARYSGATQAEARAALLAAKCK